MGLSLGRGTARRLALESLGWLLVVAGIAALVLPGPGLLALFAGLALLSHQYEWAERRMRPVERQAKKTAAESVQTWPRIALSVLFCAVLIGLGVLWVVQPPAPDPWPLDESWWLFGGWAAGVTLMISGLLALAMIVYSFRHYRGLTEEEIDRQVASSKER
jgi:uncharacterized protein (TIGR02611 family)